MHHSGRDDCTAPQRLATWSEATGDTSCLEDRLYIHYTNLHGPHTLPAPPPTALIALVEFCTTVPPTPPLRSVLRKSQDRKLALLHNVEGIEPFKEGLEVSDKVCNDEGSELGGEPKLLLVRYLMNQLGVRRADVVYAVLTRSGGMQVGSGTGRRLRNC